MSALGWLITGIEILIIIVFTFFVVIIVLALADELKNKVLKLVILLIPIVIGIVSIAGLLEYNRARSISEMLSLPGILLLIGFKLIIRTITKPTIKSGAEDESLEKGITGSEK